jgi:hypothetical protein
MGVLITTIFSLALWIVLWAIGLKSVDGFMIAVLFILLAATARVVTPYLPGSKYDHDE